VVFPLYWLIARWTENRAAFAMVLTVGLIGYAVASLAFMNWRFLL